MTDIIITKILGGYKLKTYDENTGSPKATRYYGYTLNRAIKQYRNDHGLQHKHLYKIFI